MSALTGFENAADDQARSRLRRHVAGQLRFWGSRIFRFIVTAKHAGLLDLADSRFHARSSTQWAQPAGKSSFRHGVQARPTRLPPLRNLTQRGGCRKFSREGQSFNSTTISWKGTFPLLTADSIPPRSA